MNSADFLNLKEKFSGRKILVTGDAMLDAYWYGDANRISPEAPVPVVQIKNKEFRCGGAANVAMNLKMLGAEPILCSVLGDDKEKDVLCQMLNEAGVNTEGIITSSIRPTTVKTRIIGNKNQLLRIDEEDESLLSEAEKKLLSEKIKEFLPQAELVLFEDYDKGVLSKDLIEEIITLCRQKNIPTVVDPKKNNFHFYKGVSLFKPNLRELAEGIGQVFDASSADEKIAEATHQLLKKLQAGAALITLSQRGVFITNGKDDYIVPAHIRSIYDVSGAGDTVVSVAALALLAGFSLKNIAELSNLAGGLVCEKAGVVPIGVDELAGKISDDLS